MTGYNENSSYTDLVLLSKDKTRIKSEALLYVERQRQLVFTDCGHIFRLRNSVKDLSIVDYVDNNFEDVAEIIQLSTLRYPIIGIGVPKYDLEDYGFNKAEDLSGDLKYQLIWSAFHPLRRN